MVSGPFSEDADGLFWRQLGERLRGLRRRAGLSQSEVARLMGRRPGGVRARIARLEAGKNPNPKLRLLLDYLRSCRASASEIAGVLDAYTSRKPVIEEQAKQAVDKMAHNLPPKTAAEVSSYDAKTTVARRFEDKPVEEPKKRIERSQKFAAALLQRRKLEEVLYFTIKQLGEDGTGVRRKHLADFGRKLWGILNRTRSRDRDKRPELLEQARTKLSEQRVVSDAALDAIVRRITELHHSMELTGRLDELPAVAELLPESKTPAAPEKAEKRLEREWLAKLHEYQSAREAAITKVWEGVRSEALAAKVPVEELKLYSGMVRQACYIADHSVPATAEREALITTELERLATLHQPPDLARRLLDLAVETYSRLKPGLPPDPRPAH